VWLASVITDSSDYPLLAPVWKTNRSLAIAAVPIIENGRAVGAVAWSFKEPQHFDELRRDFFLRLARECLPLVERRNARAS
jgi:GAF domain-containing protein